jgi:hypothetical protein
MHTFRCPLALFACLCGLTLLSPSILAADPPSLDVRFVTDEADAVLSILGKRAKKEVVTAADWQRLWSSEGYTRLVKREAGIGRPLKEEDVKAFVLSDALAARAGALAETLAAWTKTDPGAAGRRALAYLPAGARIRAKVYPVIKPASNSFVFEVKTDPAIFLSLDPTVPPEKLENTVAHELHHIGFGTVCPPPAVEAEIAKLPPGARTAVLWMGAFGEGIAMLAAAGGPGVHPHAVSPAADRERWDRDVARFDSDLREVDGFFRDVIAGRLDEESAQKKAFTFFGETQGPWYTVGWKMGVLVEETWGRERLIADACDTRRLLASYNEAARRRAAEGQAPALWSAAVLEAIGAAPSPRVALTSKDFPHAGQCTWIRPSATAKSATTISRHRSHWSFTSEAYSAGTNSTGVKISRKTTRTSRASQRRPGVSAPSPTGGW